MYDYDHDIYNNYNTCAYIDIPCITLCTYIYTIGSFKNGYTKLQKGHANGFYNLATGHANGSLGGF